MIVHYADNGFKNACGAPYRDGPATRNKSLINCVACLARFNQEKFEQPHVYKQWEYQRSDGNCFKIDADKLAVEFGCLVFYRGPDVHFAVAADRWFKVGRVSDEQ